MTTHPLRHLLPQANYWQLYSSLQQSGALENPQTQLELAYIRAYRDFEFFAGYFFPHHCKATFSEMHLDFCADETEPERRGRREAIAAPRGHAKTTFKLLFKTLHAIVYGYEPFIVIIGQSADEAKDKVRQVLDELESNERLSAVYGHLAPPKNRPGLKKSFITRNGIRVQAVSLGQSIRGIKHGANRPTLVILDDVETLESAMSPTQRQKTHEWFVKDVLKCGQTDGSTNVIFIGTCLHGESLLSEFLEKPGWFSRKYQAVRQFSHQEALWKKWQAIYTDLSNPNREAEAQAFYDKHQTELLAGVEVLWPEGDPYLNLMKQKIVEGTAAFYSEKQNEPFDPEMQLFRMDEATYFHVLPDSNILMLEADGKLIPREQLVSVIAYHDPAVGNDAGDTGPGDFAAIVVVGQDKAGYMYALDCFIAKAPPSVQVAEAFRLHEKWGFKTLYVEANGFQEALVEMYQDWQRRRFGQLVLPVKGEHQSENKTLRIASLEPYVTNGTLRFNRALDSRLIEQLKYFPTTHDDGPDALQGAVSKLQKPQFSSSGMQMGGPSGRSRHTPRSNSKRPWVR